VPPKWRQCHTKRNGYRVKPFFVILQILILYYFSVLLKRNLFNLMNVKHSFHCLEPIFNKAVTGNATLSYRDVMHPNVFRSLNRTLFIFNPNFKINYFVY